MQELFAKGHGTFFRSLGALLGHRPEKGSLVGKKNQKNYRFPKRDEQKIAKWIIDNLAVNWIELEEDVHPFIEKYSPSAPTEHGVAVESQLGDSPVIVRQKLHEATPMTVDEALYQMELVGHPFYLFIERATKQPCAVYHRHGWTYGVIRLDAQVM